MSYSQNKNCTVIKLAAGMLLFLALAKPLFNKKRVVEVHHAQ